MEFPEPSGLPYEDESQPFSVIGGWCLPSLLQVTHQWLVEWIFNYQQSCALCMVEKHFVSVLLSSPAAHHSEAQKCCGLVLLHTPQFGLLVSFTKQLNMADQKVTETYYMIPGQWYGRWCNAPSSLDARSLHDHLMQYNLSSCECMWGWGQTVLHYDAGLFSKSYEIYFEFHCFSCTVNFWWSGHLH